MVDTGGSHHPLALDRAASLKFSAACLRSWGDDLYWIEGRPELNGARVVVRARRGGGPEVVSPAGLSIAGRVHEYGGGALCVLDRPAGPVLVAVRAHDQAIVSFSPGAPEESVIVAGTDATFGDLAAGPPGCIVAVRERHDQEGVDRDIVVIDLERGQVESVVAGRDFFSDPRFDARGQLAWCAWDHPSMPWDGSEVWIGALAATEGGHVIDEVRHVAGGPERAASAPVHLGDRSLAMILDADDGAGLWRWSPDGGLVALSDGPGEVGQPLWILGTTSVALVAGGDDLGCIIRYDGRSEVARVVGGRCVAIPGIDGSVNEIVSTTTGVGVLGTADTALGFVAWAEASGRVDVVTLGPSIEGPVSVAEPVSVECDDGRLVHGLVYRPHPPVERPAAIVFCHGGPTGQALPGLNPLIEALTTRGFCVVEANYAGSTGFGAAYRHRIDGQWGVADVADCVSLVAGLGARGIVDASRLAIRGTSAGGFTALLGLTTGAFKAAVSWYGVADLLTLAESTHDFEARYLDRLVGPLPEARERYEERSPVNRVGEMVGAALLRQGLDDPVVPPAQASSMAAALTAKGHEVELVEFEGEGHGFRRLDTLVTAFASEVAFYERHLGSGAPTGSIDPQ